LITLGSTGAWNYAEFNIFGNAGGNAAYLNIGSTLTTQITVTYGGTAAPTCAINGPTAETNNLTYVPNSCSTFGGTTTGLQFMESNVSYATPLQFLLQ
jgi:hypothetical protein